MKGLDYQSENRNQQRSDKANQTEHWKTNDQPAEFSKGNVWSSFSSYSSPSLPSNQTTDGLLEKLFEEEKKKKYFSK